MSIGCFGRVTGSRRVRREVVQNDPPASVFLDEGEGVATAEFDDPAAHLEGHVEVVADHRGKPARFQVPVPRTACMGGVTPHPRRRPPRWFSVANYPPTQVLALRHTPAVNQPRDARARIKVADRLLWTCLSRAWRAWRNALACLQPSTVIAWQRPMLQRSETGGQRSIRDSGTSNACAQLNSAFGFL